MKRTEKVDSVPAHVAESMVGPSLGPGYERIVQTIFQVDEWGEYQELERGLRLSVSPREASYGDLIVALDGSEDNARKAHRLYCNARVALEGFEIEAKQLEAAMRSAAVAELQVLRDKGVRTKAITEGDVEATMATGFPDEWRDLAIRREKAKRTCDHLERLSDLWRSRCRTLDTMLSTMRR